MKQQKWKMMEKGDVLCGEKVGLWENTGVYDSLVGWSTYELIDPP